MFAAAMNAASAQETILWGGPGSPDGEFDGGLNGWTTVGLSSDDPTKAANAVWVWSANANSAGAYGAAVLESASKSNGAVVFDSDFLDNGGVVGAFGKGTAPAPHSGELISPKINLKGTKDVTLVFSQAFRKFQSNRPRTGPATAATAIMYSRDNGATWSEPIGITSNEFIKTNQSLSSANQPTVVTRVQLPGAGDTENFKVKFSFDGEYYFWLIDDVAIVPLENNNLQANINFYAPAENTFTPISQVRENYFLNDITNLGAKTQTNVRHTMSIYKLNASGTQIVQPAVYLDTLKYGTVLPDTIIENVPFTKAFVHSGPKANYAGFYQIISDSTDIEPWNNTLPGFSFFVTDTTFGKDNGRTRSVAPAFSGTDFTYGYGNVFYIKNGKNFRSGTLTFGLESGAANKGENIDVYLYKWSDDDNDGDITEDELSPAGYAPYTIKGSEAAPTQANPNLNLVRIRLDNFDQPGKPITLEDNTFYIAYVEHKATSGDKPMFLSSYDRLDFAAVDLAFENSGKKSFHSVIKIGETLSTGGFRAIVPTIRWNIRTIVADKEPLLAETSVAIAPNPASDFLNVKFAFETVMNDVELTVMDINGREVLAADFSNIQNDNYNLEVSALQAGVYNLLIRTEKGITTKSFVIQK